jgi:isopentenyl diphosphate isomerase/L-lactate dehydrogenase-like FMN-dependent dehydrogenase
VTDRLNSFCSRGNSIVQIFVDGGVRRASDVMKAVALGANGVGVGRPFLYAYSAYGQEGVEQAFRILHVSCFSHRTVRVLGTDCACCVRMSLK